MLQPHRRSNIYKHPLNLKALITEVRYILLLKTSSLHVLPQGPEKNHQHKQHPLQSVLQTPRCTLSFLEIPDRCNGELFVEDILKGYLETSEKPHISKSSAVTEEPD